MGRIKYSLEELIGKTPMLELVQIEKKEGLLARIYAKLEYFNPAGSVKDRVAAAMIRDAEKKRILKEDSVIIEPTSGNTGVGLACVAAAKGYRTIIVMPDTMSVERRKLICAYGQFENMSNPQIHFETTGPEIWEDMDKKVDIFIAGVGTGGTITGVGKYLKEKNKEIQIIAVEPAHSAVLSGKEAKPHKIQGIGAGFIPKVLNTDIYDEIIEVEDEEAFSGGRKMAKEEGILVGISSGAALSAAIAVAKREENKDKNIIVLLPDTGERYLSTPMFSE